jgi:hypothetical protein
MIRISCPHCGTVLGVKNPQGGTNVACLKCKQRFVLQHTPATAMADVAPPTTPFPRSNIEAEVFGGKPREATPESSKPGVNSYVLGAGAFLAILSVGIAIFFTVRSPTRPTGDPPLAAASPTVPAPRNTQPVSAENPIPRGQSGEKRPTAVKPPAGDESKPIGPAEAAKKIDEEVTVQMQVKSATLRDGTCYLNSEEDFKDDKNFTLYLDKGALAKFGEAKIEDPAAHFKGKTIQVTGKVTLYRNRPQIKVTGPNVIKVVGPK